jgi:hypothetical protein
MLAMSVQLSPERQQNANPLKIEVRICKEKCEQQA